MRYNLTDTYIKIYYESCQEFEEVRNICLQDQNWLSYNYTKERLVIEDHAAYGVVYQKSTGNPMVMGGVYNDAKMPANVARMVNREYTFLDFRMTPRDMIGGFKVTCSLIDALIEVCDYDCYYISMQNRPHRPKKRWWDVWVNSMALASNNAWIKGDGYIQTCPWNVQKCWQNFVYREVTPGSFAQWDPQMIEHEVWETLEEGT